MAEPTLTRKQVRQYVCQALRMPFFRRWTELNPDTTSSASELIDATLTQESGYWENQWCYVSTLGDTRQVVGWDLGRNALIPEVNFSAVLTDTDTYEVHQTFNALDIHDAINRAIDDWPQFFDVIMDETLVLCEDTLEYAFSSLGTAPWIVKKVWIEVPDNGFQTTVVSNATGATNDVVTVASDANLSALTTDYQFSIYDGTGKGQVRQVVSASNVAKTITVPTFTTSPAASDKARVWDSSQQTMSWRRILAVGFDQKEWPTKMYFKRRYSALDGARIRLQYIAKPVALTADDSTTFLPREYLIDKALSHLFSAMAASKRYGASRYADLAARYGQKANETMAKRHFSMPDGSLWQEDDPNGDPGGGALSNDPGDPLGWRGY